MSSLQSQTNSVPLSSSRPASVQPGGGACLELELAWGRWRRAWLRRFRPDYVRRLAELRRGDCPNCPHDIIDARDLKYVRNVCGFWFEKKDDPFQWRGQLGLAQAGWVEILCASFLALLFLLLFVILARQVHGIFWAPVPVVAVLWLQVLFFFRDPERLIPTDPDVLVSPADGTVTDVGIVDEPDFAGGRAFRVSIFLSVFNVHVNRVPRTGRVTEVRYYPGAFLDARAPECAVQNEQLWVDLEESASRRPVRVKQIAGAIARRIVCWLKPGDVVQAGERFGMIKFGSRTDVLVPAGDATEVLIKAGDKVKGGSTVLMRFRETVSSAPVDRH